MRQVRLTDFDGSANGLRALTEPILLTSYGHPIVVVRPYGNMVAGVDEVEGVPEGYAPAVDDFGNQYLAPENERARILEPARAQIAEQELVIAQLRRDLAESLQRTQRTRVAQPSRREAVLAPTPPVIPPAEVRGPIASAPRYDTQPVRSVPKPERAEKPKGRGPRR